jgi:hypothetical protein
MLPHHDSFPLGSRIRLKDGVHPGFYGGFGLPGNEGIVKGTDREQFGYPRVYVEWDKNHWAYNGAPNGWTWQDHFELIEGSDMSQKDEVDYEALLREFTERLGMASKREPEEEIPEDDSSEEAVFDDTLEKAFEDAATSKAFVVVTLNEEDMEEGPGGFIFPSAYHAAHDHKSSLIVQMQLGELAQQFQERLVKKELGDGDDEG